MPDKEPRVIVAKSIYESADKPPSSASLPIDILGKFMRYYPAYTLSEARRLPNRVVHELIRQACRDETLNRITELRISVAGIADENGKMTRYSELMKELLDSYEGLER